MITSLRGTLRFRHVAVHQFIYVQTPIHLSNHASGAVRRFSAPAFVIAIGAPILRAASSVSVSKTLGATLPCKGRVGEQSEPGWGERPTSSAPSERFTPPRSPPSQELGGKRPSPFR